MDDYKRKMMKSIGPGGLKCSCCNNSRGKLKNSHVGKDNSLNKLARKRLKTEDSKENNLDIQDVRIEDTYIHHTDL